MMELLAAGAAALGLPLNAEQLAHFAAYAALLAEWNARVNLTAITDPALVQTRHFVDSLAVAAALLDAPNPPAPFPRREGGDQLPSPKRGEVRLPAIFAGGRGLIDLG